MGKLAGKGRGSSTGGIEGASARASQRAAPLGRRGLPLACRGQLLASDRDGCFAVSVGRHRGDGGGKAIAVQADVAKIGGR